MKCKNCNATMEIDPSKQEAACPYCGAKELICDSDAVAVEKIKSSTFKEMEYAHMENQRRQQDHIEKERERKAYINGAFSKFTIAFIFACLIAVFVSFSDKYILSGIIAITQTVLFAVSWLIGMQLLKHNKKSLYRALAVLGLILIIPFFASTQIKLPEKLNWPSSGLAKNLPDPPAKYGTITADNNDLFDVDFEKMTADDYRNYINDCKDKGFTIDPDESGSSYSAYNDDGFKLVIDYSDYNNMLSRYADFSQKIDSYNTDEMSAADAAYFLEVTSRIDQKLINASLS